jgi:hypothetical protein
LLCGANALAYVPVPAIYVLIACARSGAAGPAGRGVSMLQRPTTLFVALNVLNGTVIGWNV